MSTRKTVESRFGPLVMDYPIQDRRNHPKGDTEASQAIGYPC